MKMGLTEKQYKHILSKLSEQSEAEPVKAEPEAGTSSTQAGGTGYPEVGKWESGLTRGPANQIGVTKWADVVGSKLTRSKANQLKEQYWPNPESSAYNGMRSNTPVKKLSSKESHNANTAAALILGLVPHPVTTILSGLIMAQDATQFSNEGDSKSASLGYIFAAIGLFTPIAKIPYVKNLGAKGMAKIGEKLSQGVKLLPEENVIVNKIIQSKDVIVQQLKKTADWYKNSKFSKSKVGKVVNKSAPTLGLYGGIMGAHSLTYDALTSDKRINQEKSEIDNLEKLNNSVGNEKSEQPIKRKN